MGRLLSVMGIFQQLRVFWTVWARLLQSHAITCVELRAAVRPYRRTVETDS